MSKIHVKDFTVLDSGEVEIEVTNDLIEKVIGQARTKGVVEKRWDLNVLEGEIGERTIKELLGKTDIEVKRDFFVSKSGNLAIEGACSGKLSGISTSQSEWWAFILDGPAYKAEVIIFIKRERLRKLIKNLPIRTGGDNHNVKMKLLPVRDIVGVFR